MAIIIFENCPLSYVFLSVHRRPPPPRSWPESGSSSVTLSNPHKRSALFLFVSLRKKKRNCSLLGNRSGDERAAQF
jgi:hypothetical protein